MRGGGGARRASEPLHHLHDQHPLRDAQRGVLSVARCALFRGPSHGNSAPLDKDDGSPFPLTSPRMCLTSSKRQSCNSRSVIVISDCSVEFTVLCDDRTSILRDGETVGMVDIRARGVEKAIVELVLEAEVERRRVGCTRRR